MNKELTNTTNATMEVLIPGRAAILKLNWHNNETIRILNIYAPNNANEHCTFWEKIKLEWERKNIGDFNLTENPIDRAPARPDNETAMEALRELKSILNMRDEWRNENPHQRMFTFNSNHQSLSRLDQIYVSGRHTESMLDWNSNVSQIPTDHHIVSVRFAPPILPHIGKGRWSWPVGLMSDKDLIKRIINIGMDAQWEIDRLEHRSDTANPQKIWKSFKDKMTSAAKETSKKHLARINQCIRALTKDLRRITNSSEIDTSIDTRINRNIIEQEIDHLQKKQNKSTQLKARAQWAMQGETISKYWSKVNKKKAPRDIIHRL